MKYRREIDGLRAVAVIPVILFHAGFETFRGGFVGVDVFFVISGYLINTLIYQELKSGSFSIASFYERRARRILPALYFVLLASIPCAWIWLSPSDLRNYFQSLAAVSVFSSNFLFWKESGYFDTAAEMKPLLHTWSLAVEEQYYLVMPVLMIFLWRFRKSLFVFFGVLFFFSLTLAQWASTNKPSANFFLLPTRAWELLIGVYCAFYINSNSRKVLSTKVEQGASIVGVALILIAICYFSKKTPFPGVYALIPTVGAALIILFAKPTNAVGSMLSSRYLVQLGLISYSAYLWHQPILSFARHRSLVSLDQTALIGLCVLSIVAAYLSWKYIEKPFRQAGFLSRSAVFVLTAIGMVVFLSASYFGYKYNEGNVLAEFSWTKNKEFTKKFKGITIDGENCSGRDPEQPCELSDGYHDKTLVVIGDSHARVITQAVYQSMSVYRVRLIDQTASGCPFLLGLNVYINGVKNNECSIDYQNKRLRFLQQLKPSIVVFVSRLPLYINGEGFNNSVGGIELLDPFFVSKSSDSNVLERIKEIRESFFYTVQSVLEIGHKVVIVGPVPANGWDPLSRLYKIQRFGLANNQDERIALMQIPYSAISEWHKSAVSIIKEIVAKHSDVIYVNPEELFCDDHYCSSINYDNILYADSNHLSLAGSSLLLSKIMNSLHIKENK